MFSKPTTIINLVASVMTGTSSRRLALAIATVFLGSTNASPALLYDFLTVTGNGIGGNLATSQFTSPNALGVINVTHAFSPGGAGPSDNLNPLIFPSQFTTLFPGTGQVQGHLAQTRYGLTANTFTTSTVTFNLTGYTIQPDTVFGIWNTTTEVAQPAYRVEVIDSSNALGPPTGFVYVGNQDNQPPQTGAANQLVMNLATGNITAGLALPANPNGNVHTDAAFWKIPVGTKQIIVHGNLGPIPGNLQGDGVGYYFAECVVPEPSTCLLLLTGLCGLLIRHRSRGA